MDLGKDPKHMKMPHGMIMEVEKEGPMYPCVYIDDIEIPGAKLGKEYTFKGTCSEINQSKDGNSYKFEIKSVDGIDTSEDEEEPEDSIEEVGNKFLKKKQKGSKQNDKAAETEY